MSADAQTRTLCLDLHASCVYGPVRSRRLGSSLGINVVPPGRKVCSFNCLYCQYGWTPASRRSSGPVEIAWPDPPDVARAVAGALEALITAGTPPDRLTLAGDGEPTLHPRFAALVDGVRDVRDRLAPEVRLAVLSNSSTVHDPMTRTALGRVDERYMKLDAGDESLARRLSASRWSFSSALDGLSRLAPFTVQTMFVRDTEGRIDNSHPAAVGRWLDALRRLRPLAVHVYTLDRPPAWPALQPIPTATLRAIAGQVRSCGIEAYAFPPSSPDGRATALR